MCSNRSFTFYGFCEIWREMWIFAEVPLGAAELKIFEGI